MNYLKLLLLGAVLMLQQTYPSPGPAARPHSAGGTWTINQFKYYSSTGTVGTGGSNCPTTGAVCTVTVAAIAAHDIVVCFTNIGKTTTATLSACSGETYTHCPSCATWNSSDGGQDASYVLSATGGETAVTCTVSAATGFNSCGVFDVAYSGSSASYDTSGNTTTAACTSCQGQTLTLSGTNDLIVSFMNPDDLVTAVTSPYSLNAGFSDDYGVAAAVNLSSGTGPLWTQNISGTSEVSALAIKGN